MITKNNNIELGAGASRGIGRASATGLAGLGCRLVITARNSNDPKEVSNETTGE